MTNYIIIALASFLACALFFYYYYATRYKNFIKTFINTNNQITLIADVDSIFLINEAGLRFFAYESIKSFIAMNSTISKFFLEEQGKYYDKYTDGKRWLEKVETSNKKRVKVKMLTQDKKVNYFYIEVSKLNYEKKYLLSFYNITHLEEEKAEIMKESEIDPLTQVYNRVKINETFKKVIYQTSYVSGYSFSIILLDIDHFKAINDEYGHSVGDKVLKELARLINMNLRKNDLFARWGGEEFIVIAERSSLRETLILAERLRRYIDNYSFEVVKHVTCSLGVTEFKSGDTENLILERVDVALYEAKEGGRNQVVPK